MRNNFHIIDSHITLVCGKLHSNIIPIGHMVLEIKNFMDQSAPGRSCSLYHAKHLHFPRTFFLVPNFGCVGSFSSLRFPRAVAELAYRLQFPTAIRSLTSSTCTKFLWVYRPCPKRLDICCTSPGPGGVVFPVSFHLPLHSTFNSNSCYITLNTTFNI